MTPEEYSSLLEQIHDLIMAEIESTRENSFAKEMFPKLVLMYQFFGFLRGEAFDKVRPITPGMQDQFYKWENEISGAITILRDEMGFPEAETEAFFEGMKSYFK